MIGSLSFERKFLDICLRPKWYKLNKKLSNFKVVDKGAIDARVKICLKSILLINK